MSSHAARAQPRPQKMNPTQKALRPRPPDKGSFPLDHEGQCKEFMERYMKCLSKHGHEHVFCRDVARDYLECRMEKELMAREEFTRLGYKEQNR